MVSRNETDSFKTIWLIVVPLTFDTQKLKCHCFSNVQTTCVNFSQTVDYSIKNRRYVFTRRNGNDVTRWQMTPLSHSILDEVRRNSIRHFLVNFIFKHPKNQGTIWVGRNEKFRRKSRFIHSTVRYNQASLKKEPKRTKKMAAENDVISE